MVGSGSITQSEHLPNWMALPGAQVVGLVSRNPERGRTAASAFDLTWFAAMEDAFVSTRVDAVHIAASLAVHPDLVARAIAAGKHVLVEKPFAGTAAVGKRLVAAAEAAGVVLNIGYQKQTDADVAYITDLVSSGRLGRLMGVHSVFRFSQPSLFMQFGPLPARHIPDPDDLHERLLEQSIHHFNVFHTWLEGEISVESVVCRSGLWQVAGASAETAVSHLNARASGHGEEFWAYFEGGSAHVSIWSPHFAATQGGVEVFESWADRRYQPITPRQNPYKVMNEHFRQMVAGERDWRPDAERALKDLALVERIETRLVGAE
jgi:predicted dehydrogenase